MTRAAEPLILLCNDDGAHRAEIRVLRRRLGALGQAVIVAPDRERSAFSLALTLRHPLRLHRDGPGVWSVDGTPADCVYLAVDKVLPRRPDLLISGLNPGPNLGQLDAHYSGTVAAAFQGTFFGIPSLAVSMIPDAAGRFYREDAADVVFRLAERILASGLPDGVTLNVNIPAPPLRGLRITRLGRKFYERDVLEERPARSALFLDRDRQGLVRRLVRNGHPDDRAGIRFDHPAADRFELDSGFRRLAAAEDLPRNGMGLTRGLSPRSLPFSSCPAGA